MAEHLHLCGHTLWTQALLPFPLEHPPLWSVPQLTPTILVPFLDEGRGLLDFRCFEERC